jgi:4a-hydroxytetrahydrobiopterin dehydratase
MPRRRLLDEKDIVLRLKEVPTWRRRGGAITRTWTFGGFPLALAFINRIGALAEAANHHPDIYNSWATVRLTLTTHDVGGLTDRDFDLAKQIDALSEQTR